MNAERAEVGAPRLARYTGMDATAQDWADVMADADTLAHRPVLAPYRGEIIASGAETASDAMTLWLLSPPHRQIMLDPRYTMAGIGYNSGYWTVIFS
jgi:uncharacterized protein YkwD